MAENGNITTKSRIIQAIADCKDDAMRSVLLIMLAVLEEIGSKIDAVMHDEQALREIVLNGHTATHGADHDWIAKFRGQAHEYPDDHAWIARKRAEEEDDKRSKRRVGEDVISHIIVAGLSVAGTVVVTYLLHGAR